MGVKAEGMLSPQELADYVGVPLQTVYKWRRERTGPIGYKVGRHVRYTRAAVERWLQEHADDRPARA